MSLPLAGLALAGLASAGTDGMLACPIEKGGFTERLGNYSGVIAGPSPGEPAVELHTPDDDTRDVYTRTPPRASFGPYPIGGMESMLDVWATPIDNEVVARVRSSAGTRWWMLKLEAGDDDLSGLRVDAVETGGTPVPVVIVTFGTSEFTNGGERAGTYKVVLDFRGPVPRRLAQLECSWSDTRDYCSGGGPHKDAAFRNGGSVGCTWDAARDGFVCRDTSYAGTAWGGRFWSSTVELATGAIVPLPRLEAAHTAERIDGVGALTPLAEVESRLNGRPLRLFAARGPGLRFDPRFFLVRGGKDPTIEEIEIHDRDPRGPDDDHALQPEWLGNATPDRDDLTFTVTPVIAGARRLHVFQVVATEGTGRGLYWVAVEDGESPVAHAVRLASDIAYPVCGGLVHPATAVRVTALVAGDDARVELDMEPARFDLGGYELVRSSDAETITRQCPWTARVRWRSRQGFAWEDDLTPCARPAEPRNVRLAPDGRVEVVPIEAP